MNKRKKHRFYHNWSFGSAIIWVLITLLVGALITNIIITKMLGIKSIREQNSFTSADWDYMINEIEEMYGNGRNFIVFKKYTDEITKRRINTHCIDGYNHCYEDVYIGEKAYIIGNFENDDTGYFVSFSRYISDSPYKSGNNVIIHVYTNNHYSIEEYK